MTGQQRIEQHRARRRRVGPRWLVLGALGITLLLLAGCSLLFGSRSETPEAPAAEEEDRVLVPTFTPTPEGAAPTPEPPTPEPTPVQVVEAPPETAGEPVTATQEITAAEVPSAAIPTTEITTTSSVTGADALTESAPTTTTAPAEAAAPQLVVVNEVVNARGGPGTNYGIVGSVSRDQTFEIVGKNPEGTWWQFCCVNGQTAWVFGELVRAENAEAVPVAQDIPAPPEPLAAAPPPAEAAPAQPAPEPAPTNTPEPQPAAPPAQAVNAGPCGGDDGCKFRISGGPTVRPNGGFELKFQLLFKHSGVDGGQPQGDYRLGIEKDGQLITYFGDVRSIALTRNQGPMGDYNYEAKLNASELPGGTVAGAYFFWVLDGNRERDSEVFRLDLAPDQGEVWIEFDQG